MTKSFRTAAVVTMVAALATSSIAAQSADSSDKSTQEIAGNDARMNMPFMAHNFHGHNMMHDGKNVVIGQISSVDKNKGVLKVKNSDGKDVEIHVSPFARVMICDPDARPSEMPPQSNSANDRRGFQRGMNRPGRESYSLADLKKGSWVMVGTYETSTKVLEASVIRAEQKLAVSTDVTDAK